MALYERKCRECGKWARARDGDACPWCKAKYGPITLGLDVLRDFEPGDVIVDPKTAGRKGEKREIVGDVPKNQSIVPKPGEFGYVPEAPKRGQS